MNTGYHFWNFSAISVQTFYVSSITRWNSIGNRKLFVYIS